MTENGNEARIDALLFKLGITRSRSEAEDLIKRGLVSVRVWKSDEFMVVKKPSKSFQAHLLTKDDVQVSGDQYVGRGAYKIEHALDYWKIDPTNLVGLDIGSSTGGFTEVLLRRGAQKVFAVDVGSNQLAKELLENPKVVSLESTDIRTLGFLPSIEASDNKQASAVQNTPVQHTAVHSSRADIVVIDVSFISLGQIFPHLKRFVSVQNPIVIALIKPQFEVGKAYIQKNGVVADAAQVKTALERVKEEALEEGWICKEVIESPIHGGQGGSGNTEYLGYFVQK